MFRKILLSFNITTRRNFKTQKSLFYERRRRKGDGTKTDIFEERAAASQETYFRKKTARQLALIKEKLLVESGKLDKKKDKKSKDESDILKKADNAEPVKSD